MIFHIWTRSVKRQAMTTSISRFIISKPNFFSKRPDGYHIIETVFYRLEICEQKTSVILDWDGTQIWFRRVFYAINQVLSTKTGCWHACCIGTTFTIHSLLWKRYWWFWPLQRRFWCPHADQTVLITVTVTRWWMTIRQWTRRPWAPILVQQVWIRPWWAVARPVPSQSLSILRTRYTRYEYGAREIQLSWMHYLKSIISVMTG